MFCCATPMTQGTKSWLKGLTATIKARYVFGEYQGALSNTIFNRHYGLKLELSKIFHKRLQDFAKVPNPFKKTVFTNFPFLPRLFFVERSFTCFLGIVVSNRPLRTNEVFQVKVNKLNERWTSSFSIGLIGFSPDSVHLPITAVGLKRNPAVVLRSVIIKSTRSITYPSEKS